MSWQAALGGEQPERPLPGVRGQLALLAVPGPGRRPAGDRGLRELLNSAAEGSIPATMWAVIVHPEDNKAAWRLHVGQTVCLWRCDQIQPPARRARTPCSRNRSTTSSTDGFPANRERPWLRGGAWTRTGGWWQSALGCRASDPPSGVGAGGGAVEAGPYLGRHTGCLGRRTPPPLGSQLVASGTWLRPGNLDAPPALT